MELLKEIYSTLSTTPAVISHLAEGAGGVWADLTDYSGRRPVIAYSVISDVPSLFGDDMEIGRRVTVQISIVTTDGADNAIVKGVNAAMQRIGWTRESTNRVTDGKDRITALRFMILDTEKEGI